MDKIFGHLNPPKRNWSRTPVVVSEVAPNKYGKPYGKELKNHFSLKNVFIFSKSFVFSESFIFQNHSSF